MSRITRLATLVQIKERLVPVGGVHLGIPATQVPMDGAAGALNVDTRRGVFEGIRGPSVVSAEASGRVAGLHFGKAPADTIERRFVAADGVLYVDGVPAARGT